MGMGLGWSNANAAMAGGIRQRLVDQLNQQQAEQHMALAEREMKLRESEAGIRAQEHGMNIEQNKATLAERAQTHAEQQTEREMTTNRGLNETIAPGTFLEDTPAQRPLIGRLQSVGGATMEPNQQDRPAVDVGPLQPGDTGGAMKRGFLKMASQAQGVTQASADAKVEAARLVAENRANDNEQKGLDRLAQIRASAAASAGNRGLQDEMTRLRIQGEKDKQDTTHKATADKEESARQSTAVALDLVNRLETHPGLDMSSGLISSHFAGLSQSATDANALRDQLVATLTLPNLGTLKGPMSDRDVVFVKQLATRLGNHSMSDTETRTALQEAKAFLQSKSDQQGGPKSPAGPQAPPGWKYVPKPGGGWTAVEDKQ